MTILDFRIVLKDGTIVMPDRVHALKPILNVAHLKGNVIVDLRENPLDMATGFRDRYNKLVYERDIIEVRHSYLTSGTESEPKPQTMTAVWSKEHGMWILEGDGALWLPLAKYASKGKVIGRAEPA